MEIIRRLLSQFAVAVLDGVCNGVEDPQILARLTAWRMWLCPPTLLELVQKGDTEKLRERLLKKPDLANSPIHRKSKTMLLHASVEGPCPVTTDILLEFNANTLVRDDDGRTPLVRALDANRLTQAVRIVMHEAATNSASSVDKPTKDRLCKWFARAVEHDPVMAKKLREILTIADSLSFPRMDKKARPEIRAFH